MLLGTPAKPWSIQQQLLDCCLMLIVADIKGQIFTIVQITQAFKF
jgi:hypothetical protein